jgi:hypothetical protein
MRRPTGHDAHISSFLTLPPPDVLKYGERVLQLNSSFGMANAIKTYVMAITQCYELATKTHVKLPSRAIGRPTGSRVLRPHPAPTIPAQSCAHCSPERSRLLGNYRFTAKLTGTSRAARPIPAAQAGFFAEAKQA